MKKQWTVTAADGMNHVIEYKGRSFLVDGQKYPLKSSNWFIQLIDYAINFGETQCRLVVMGNKVDLAVNGRYLGSGEPYQPIASLPVYVSVLAGISCVLGFLMNSWLGLCLGVLIGVMYFNLALKKKNGIIVVAFIIASILQVALGIGVAFLLS